MKRLLLGLVVGAVGYCLIFRASAQNIEIGTGLVCDKAEQVETVGALFPEKGHQGAVDAINEKSPDSCGILTVAYVVGETKSKITVGERYYIIVEIAVVAIATNGQWQRLTTPLVQYTAIEIKSDHT